MIVFNEMSANNGTDGKFKGFGSDKDELTFEITASQAGKWFLSCRTICFPHSEDQETIQVRIL